MRAVALWPGHEEARIELDTAIDAGVELDHPAVEALWIELRIDGAVERISEIDAPPVAADLDHLRSAVQSAVAGCDARATIPPIRTLPVSFGLNGSLTSYWRRSPVPQHAT